MNNLQFKNSLRKSPQASRENPNHLAQPCVDHTAPSLYSHLQDCAATVSLPCRTVDLGKSLSKRSGRSTVGAQSEYNSVWRCNSNGNDSIQI